MNVSADLKERSRGRTELQPPQPRQLRVIQPHGKHAEEEHLHPVKTKELGSNSIYPPPHPNM